MNLRRLSPVQSLLHLHIISGLTHEHIMTLYFSAQLCLIEEFLRMSWPLLAFFSSSSPCLTHEFLCHFWHKSFVTSLLCKSIFPNSSLASAVPPWNCISESFCDVSFVLSLWDSACPQNTSLTHGSGSLLHSKPFDAHCCCQQPAVCLSLSKDVLSSLFLLSQTA